MATVHTFIVGPSGGGLWVLRNKVGIVTPTRLPNCRRAAVRSEYKTRGRRVKRDAVST